ncbi:ABC transporter permease [Solibacillus sp.]|uniref:ABC transporter permease n=1 Tax=Solibacillus sp. TaxID=1909654 RepID=UPI003314EF10
MFKQQEIENIQRHKKKVLLLYTLGMLFFSGIHFTFVIPGLKGFDFLSLVMTCVVYFTMGGFLSALYTNKARLVFFATLVLSTAGMGWRIWLEWGEFSLVEHMQVAVFIGYPIVTTLFIVLSYWCCEKMKQRSKTSDQQIH